MSIRETLLAEPKRRYAEEEIEGVGTIRCQSLNAEEAAILEASYLNGDGAFEAYRFAARKSLVIGMSLVDEHYKRHFADILDADGEINPVFLEETANIGKQDAAIVDAIYEVCERHINKERVTAKNSKETSAGDSQAVLPIGAAG